jgi:hypothetical protein
MTALSGTTNKSDSRSAGFYADRVNRSLREGSSRPGWGRGGSAGGRGGLGYGGGFGRALMRRSPVSASAPFASPLVAKAQRVTNIVLMARALGTVDRKIV